MGKGSLKNVNYHMKGIYDIIFVLYHLQFFDLWKIRFNAEDKEKS